MRNGLLVLAVALTALLAGCESSEQRAEKHFQSALALLAEGDTDRAIVEFRNVFKLNAEHLKARLAFAGLMEAQGSTGVAYREFLLAAEQAPENLGARAGHWHGWPPNRAGGMMPRRIWKPRWPWRPTIRS